MTCLFVIFESSWFAGVLIEAGAAYEWAGRALPRMRTRAAEKLAYVNR
jgi:hypothetical protein